MDRDLHFPQPAHIKIVLLEIPDGYSGTIALAVEILEQITKLPFQTAGAKLADKIKKPATHETELKG